MQALMMNQQLTITTIMEHCDRSTPNVEVVSVTADNPLHRYTYKDAFARVRKLANALAELGLQQGDRIATLAWNDYRHFELYYGISCSGYVCHTINPRLFPEQIDYIVNHADDQWLFLDVMFVPLIEKLAPALPNVKGYVVMTDEAHMPDSSLPNVHCYEPFIAPHPDQFDWPDLDENMASSMCYTSGTTGNPKGVVYSHRSTLLHTLAAGSKQIMDVGADDVIMPIVPMFHVNAWGTPYGVPMTGAKLVFPGPKMGDGEALTRLINAEKVTFSMGVPTVWLALANYLDASGEQVPTLKRVTVGGAACPLSVMKAMERYDVWMQVGWGMTEMSPIGTFNPMRADTPTESEEERDRLRQRAGKNAFGVQMKIVDEDNNELPWDGVSSGALKVKGFWITRGYYGLDDEPALDEDGWFDTGDVAVIDENGSMNITDRTKDVIKSGGEWISSIDVENAAMQHEDVLEAAVIGVPHPKWTERPLLIVVPTEGKADSIDTSAVLSSLEGKIAKWWIPEACEKVDSLPHTATGKVSKKDLRVQFKDFEYS